MKATVKALLPGYTGNMDDVVIYFNSKLNMMIARKKVMPRFIPPHDDLKPIFALARRIGLSDAWKDDCNKYITAYNSKFRRKNKAQSSWPSVWIKMMKAQKKAIPELDFTTLTREEILERNLPCKSLATAIQAGFLDLVRNWEKFTSLV